MPNEGLNSFEKCTPDVYICHLRKKSAPFHPEGTVNCSHLAL